MTQRLERLANQFEIAFLHARTGGTGQTIGAGWRTRNPNALQAGGTLPRVRAHTWNLGKHFSSA
jgi:hypothetical protein